MAVLHAQQYGFRQYSLADGVAQSQVFALLEDHQGYLWLGTQGGGLNRWDGLRFDRFSIKDGLGNGKIYSLFEDSRQTMWIGTQSGFSEYDGQRFLHHDFPESPAAVYAICEGKNGQIYLGSSNGLWTIRHDSLLRVHGMESAIHALATTGDSLWVGSNAGLTLIVNDNLLALPPGISANKAVEVLKTDSLGRLWVGAYASELHYLDKSSFRSFSLPWADALLCTDIAWTVKGDLWVATQDQGAANWSSRDSVWTTYGISDGLPNRYVRCLLVDSWDNVWMGTSGSGLCRYTGLPFVYFDRKNGLPEQAVYSLLEDKDCRIWMGNGQTVGYLQEERFVNLSDQPGFKRSKFKSMAQDKESRIWLGSEGEGVALVSDTGFLWFDERNGLASPWVRSLATDPDGSIWVGTASAGLSHITWSSDSNGITWDIRNSRIQGNNPEASINQLLFDETGALWVATRNMGLLRRSPANVWTRYLEEEGSRARDIRSLTIDEDGSLWLGTADAGVIRLRITDSTEVVWYDDILSSQIIYLLAFDEYGSLWIGSERGIDRATIDEAGTLIEVEHFAQEEGFLGIETCQNAAMLDRDGRLWVGTVNGLGRWQAGITEHQATVPHLILQEARLFYTNIRNTPYRDLLNPWNEFNGTWTLPHNRNHVSFDLLGIDHDRPQEVLYQWQLIGSEPEWSPASPRRTATFSNLPPGSYTFRARAGLPEGGWSDTLDIDILIKPPFWAMWWFRIAAAVAVALIVFAIFRIRINQVKRRAAVEQRRLEMEKDLIELEQKALRLQMNPHFIFNALNSIQALITRQDPKSARYFLAKFSRLMRQVLENSRHAYVSLDEEIQVLEDYLTLERFSREESFDFHIHIDEELIPGEEKVPPMLLQPFLENAIIHGVAHLSDKKGRIQLDVFAENQTLVCQITDNGVGRKRAATLKSQQQAQHKSMALAVTQERLERLAIEGHSAPQLVVEDLAFPDGSPAGTKVSLRIPLQA